MLQAFLRKLGYSWKHFHKSLERLQDERVYKQKLAELRQLVILSTGGYMGLFLADESGFNMEDYVHTAGSPEWSTSN